MYSDFITPVTLLPVVPMTLLPVVYHFCSQRFSHDIQYFCHMVLYICTQDIKSLLINSFHTYSFQITSRQKFILPFSKLLDTNIYTDILYIKVALFCNHLILPWYGFVLTWSISDLHTNLSYCIETLLQFAHMHSNPDIYLFVLPSASPDHCTHRHLLSSHVLFFLNNSWTQIIKTSSYLRLTSSCVSSSCLRAYCSSPHNFTQFAKQNYKLLLESLWSPKFCLSHKFLSLCPAPLWLILSWFKKAGTLGCLWVWSSFMYAFLSLHIIVTSTW